MGKAISDITFPELKSYPNGPFTAGDAAMLKGFKNDILRQMCRRGKIPTTGLQRKQQFVEALIQNGSNEDIKNMRFEAKPEAKRKRKTESLHQDASSIPVDTSSDSEDDPSDPEEAYYARAVLQPIKEFNEAIFADYSEFFETTISSNRFLLFVRTMEFPNQQIPVGNEDVAPYVTIVGSDRLPIISKFPLHIWRDYFYEGFEDKIQAFSLVDELGHMLGQHFLVSKVPTQLYPVVQLLFTQMANAKRDGTPFAVDPSNEAAGFFGLQQSDAASLSVNGGSLSSEFNEMQYSDAAFLPFGDDFLFPPEPVVDKTAREGDDYPTPESWHGSNLYEDTVNAQSLAFGAESQAFAPGLLDDQLPYSGDLIPDFPPFGEEMDAETYLNFYGI